MRSPASPWARPVRAESPRACVVGTIPAWARTITPRSRPSSPRRVATRRRCVRGCARSVVRCRPRAGAPPCSVTRGDRWGHAPRWRCCSRPRSSRSWPTERWPSDCHAGGSRPRSPASPATRPRTSRSTSSSSARCWGRSVADCSRWPGGRWPPAQPWRPGPSSVACSRPSASLRAIYPGARAWRSAGSPTSSPTITAAARPCPRG